LSGGVCRIEEIPTDVLTQVYFFSTEQKWGCGNVMYFGQSVVEEVYSTQNYTSSLFSGKNVKTCFTFDHKALEEPCILVEIYRCFVDCCHHLLP
jgi:hypothetical protein